MLLCYIELYFVTNSVANVKQSKTRTAHEDRIISATVLKLKEYILRSIAVLKAIGQVLPHIECV